jgi:hypothetical protein
MALFLQKKYPEAFAAFRKAAMQGEGRAMITISAGDQKKLT